MIEVFAMAEGRVSRISVSVPPDLLLKFDETVNSLGYTRSKAIQVAMRDFITDYKWGIEEKGTVTGALNMVYDHETKGLEETITDIQHRYRETITSTIHIHLDERNCLEIVAVKGEVKKIQSLAKELTAQRGIKQLKLATLEF